MPGLIGLRKATLKFTEGSDEYLRKGWSNISMSCTAVDKRIGPSGAVLTVSDSRRPLF